jgi:hypothetical protein
MKSYIALMVLLSPKRITVSLPSHGKEHKEIVVGMNTYDI